jgi:hypothetical protein
MSRKKTPKPSPVEVLDTISHHVAVAAAENARPTAEDLRWSRELGVQLEARLAELRRRLTPADEPVEKAKPIRPSTLAMARDQLLEGIARITRAMGGAVQYAHRNLTGLSLDDLRRLYDTLDTTNRDTE